MKPVGILLLIATLAILCMGMGGLGGHPEGSVPATDILIQAEVTDRIGTATRLDQFSMEGKSYLESWRGQGRLTIPLQKIDVITFGAIKGDEIQVEVKLKSGELMTLTLRAHAQFYGSTGFGAFQIKSRDIGRIDFP